MDWLDLLAVQEILKSLLEHHSLKVSILGHLAFFFSQILLFVFVLFGHAMGHVES